VVVAALVAAADVDQVAVAVKAAAVVDPVVKADADLVDQADAVRVADVDPAENAGDDGHDEKKKIQVSSSEL
jgi:hypothetical protein